MLSKNKIKHINSLKSGKFREEFQQFIAEGDKIVGDLLNSNLKIIEIYAAKEWIEKNNLNSTITIFEISESELERISQLKTPNKVLALVQIPKDIEILNSVFEELILVLDEIKDPGNMGTIIRMADWYGICNIICSKNSVDIYNPKVVQATMGSIGRVNVYYRDLKEFFNSLPYNIPVYGTLLDGENIYKQELTDNGLVVIGNESRGISEEILPYLTHKISIPSFSRSISNSAESLNASIATAIICSEFKRKQINK